MVFAQHGSYHLDVKNNVVIAKLEGTWNKETAESFAQDFQTIAKDLAPPWGHLVYLDEWELCSPDMFPIIANLVEWCIQSGLSHAANVYHASAMKTAFMNQMVVEQTDGFIRVVFDNEYDAIDWLAEAGFHVS
jgi:hypothetical protein